MLDVEFEVLATGTEGADTARSAGGAGKGCSFADDIERGNGLDAATVFLELMSRYFFIVGERGAVNLSKMFQYILPEYDEEGHVRFHSVGKKKLIRIKNLPTDFPDINICIPGSRADEGLDVANPRFLL